MRRSIAWRVVSRRVNKSNVPIRMRISAASQGTSVSSVRSRGAGRRRRDRRQLLEAYYLNQREELPARLGITPNAVRLRVFKEKRRLRDCMVRCAKLAAYSFMATAENAVPAPMLSFERRSHRK
jgi:hypothetical protein